MYITEACDELKKTIEREKDKVNVTYVQGYSTYTNEHKTRVIKTLLQSLMGQLDLIKDEVEDSEDDDNSELIRAWVDAIHRVRDDFKEIMFKYIKM